MVKKNTTESIGQQIANRFNSFGGSVLIAITLVGTGAGVATYFSNFLHKLEINNLDTKFNQEINDVKEKKDSIIRDLNKEIYVLQLENEKLKEDE